MNKNHLEEFAPGNGDWGRTGAAQLKIRTNCLELIAATPRLLRAELTDRNVFSEMLGARVPESWPPELYDRAAAEWTLNYLEGGAERAAWAMWYVILVEPALPRRVLAGVVGYKGPPSPERTVEIGYGVLTEFRRAGYATEASLALIERAFAHPDVDSVLAETFPHLIASIGVLEKLGFVLTGPGSEEGVIRFALPRSAFSQWSRNTAALPESTQPC